MAGPEQQTPSPEISFEEKARLFDEAAGNLIGSISFGPRAEDNQWRSGGPEPIEAEREAGESFIRSLLGLKEKGEWGSVEEALDENRGFGFTEDERKRVKVLINFLKNQGITEEMLRESIASEPTTVEPGEDSVGAREEVTTPLEELITPNERELVETMRRLIEAMQNLQIGLFGGYDVESVERGIRGLRDLEQIISRGIASGRDQDQWQEWRETQQRSIMVQEQLLNEMRQMFEPILGQINKRGTGFAKEPLRHLEEDMVARGKRGAERIREGYFPGEEEKRPEGDQNWWQYFNQKIMFLEEDGNVFQGDFSKQQEMFELRIFLAGVRAVEQDRIREGELVRLEEGEYFEMIRQLEARWYNNDYGYIVRREAMSVADTLRFGQRMRMWHFDELFSIPGVAEAVQELEAHGREYVRQEYGARAMERFKRQLIEGVKRRVNANQEVRDEMDTQGMTPEAAFRIAENWWHWVYQAARWQWNGGAREDAGGYDYLRRLYYLHDRPYKKEGKEYKRGEEDVHRGWATRFNKGHGEREKLRKHLDLQIRPMFASSWRIEGGRIIDDVQGLNRQVIDLDPELNSEWYYGPSFYFDRPPDEQDRERDYKAWRDARGEAFLKVKIGEEDLRGLERIFLEIKDDKWQEALKVWQRERLRQLKEEHEDVYRQLIRVKYVFKDEKKEKEHEKMIKYLFEGTSRKRLPYSDDREYKEDKVAPDIGFPDSLENFPFREIAQRKGFSKINADAYTRNNRDTANAEKVFPLFLAWASAPTIENLEAIEFSLLEGYLTTQQTRETFHGFLDGMFWYHGATGKIADAVPTTVLRKRVHVSPSQKDSWRNNAWTAATIRNIIETYSTLAGKGEERISSEQADKLTKKYHAGAVMDFMDSRVFETEFLGYDIVGFIGEIFKGIFGGLFSS